MQRNNYTGTPSYGMQTTMDDAGMAQVLDAYRAAHGEKPAVMTDGVETEPARAYTDDEITDLMFSGILQGMIDQGNRQAKLEAAKEATDSIPPIDAPVTREGGTRSKGKR